MEKKWYNRNEDITDYFNYGFTEEVWRTYVEKVKTLERSISREAIIQKTKTSNQNLKTLKNDALPLELGGFGEPFFKEVADFNYLSFLRTNKNRFFYSHLVNPPKDFNANFGLQLQGALRP